MNWKRGLFRAWIAATILWLAYSLYALRSGDWSDAEGFAFLLGPPIAAPIIGFIAFYGGGWIAKGFRPSVAPTVIEKQAAVQESETGHAHPELKGIGGWLLLLAFGQVVSTILTPVMMLVKFSQYPSLRALPGLPAAIVGEIFISVFVTSYVLYTTSMMFQSRSTFPKLYRYQWVVFGLSPVLNLAWFALVTGHFPARALVLLRHKR